MTTLFISDLHLDAKQPEMTAIFLNFLQKHASQAEALYILGDFFEVWIGDDYETELSRKISTALHAVTQKGIPIYIMHGNRDFLLGTEFMRATGCQLLPDPTVIDLYGRPTLLMHGDTLCIDDHAYQRFRQQVRDPVKQSIFLQLPLTLRRGIARFLRWQSQRKGKQDYIDANSAEIKRVMLAHNVDFLIHGHTHRPCIQYFELEEKSALRIVLSDWDNKQGSVLVCEPQGQKLIGWISASC